MGARVLSNERRTRIRFIGEFGTHYEGIDFMPDDVAEVDERWAAIFIQQGRAEEYREEAPQKNEPKKNEPKSDK
ncbi:MAG TPA: hypothetical protein VNQ79_29265 [Blastocatellia bacterium]|nr:hypothetical protein [Blastocatellia bacterium]